MVVNSAASTDPAAIAAVTAVPFMPFPIPGQGDHVTNCVFVCVCMTNISLCVFSFVPYMKYSHCKVIKNISVL